MFAIIWILDCWLPDTCFLETYAVQFSEGFINFDFELSFYQEQEQINGFNESEGQCWIYPVNYPLRSYQFNIVQKALFWNTLVTLPTGMYESISYL